MAERIGKANVEFCRRTTDDEGNVEISFRICPESRWAMKSILDHARELKEQGNPRLVMTLERYRKKRSLDQNRMMWALLEIMANAHNGGRTGGVTAWDCYLDMLEKYGARYEYLQCTKEAFPALKNMFRAIKVIEEREKDTVMCKAYIGSSQFTIAEMTQMIDGLFDELAALGVEDDDEARYLREEWIRR